ncbi:MAG: flagellar hook-associated protein FlgK [Oscillospiraceae bacterium]|jgi:flagellar hook-associated protein 1 FlgK|nr:flagellar hook-associated protein FlgK [Oscillospiraceae bacterium]
MRPTFSGIEIGRSGLVVSQKGLDVTSHNIANVDTKGYTRQRIVQTAIEPYNSIRKFRPVDKGLVGQGTTVMILDQIRSEFLDSQFRVNNSVLGYWDTRTQGLRYMQTLFESVDGGSLENSMGITIQDCVADLFSSFIVGETEANAAEERLLIQQSAISLAESFNLTYQRLQAQMADQDAAVKVLVEKINILSEGISELNRSIYSYEILGEPALDLRDKRNVMLDELSALAEIEYSGNGVGEQFTLTLGGNVLVSHVTTTKLLVAQDKSNVVPGEPNVYNIYYDADGDGVVNPGNDVLFTDSIPTGELKAHLDLRDGDSATNKGIAYYMEEINTFTRALVQEINKQHRKGYSHPLSGSSNNKIAFWGMYDSNGNVIDVDETDPTELSKLTAGNLRLSNAITNDVYNIAFSDKEIITDPALYDPNIKTFSGNNENMRKLYQLRNIGDITLITGQYIGSLPGYLAGTMLDFSVTLNHSANLADIHDVQTHDVDNLRLSISSVSLDDEMVNMIKYQHAYEGASRMITAMDEALDILINRTGLVGRS